VWDLEGERESYACAPSLRAMKGRRLQSFSTAGSVPGSAPSQSSTSGPLYMYQHLSCLSALMFLQRKERLRRMRFALRSHSPRMMKVDYTHKRVKRGHGAGCPSRNARKGSRMQSSRSHGKAAVPLLCRTPGEDAVTRVHFSLMRLGCLRTCSSARHC
jgi:hypothetical protein